MEREKKAAMLANEEFMAAAKAGDRVRVTQMLGRDATLAAARDARGVSVICLTVYAGHHELAQMIAHHRAALDIFEASAIGDAHRVTALVDDDPKLVNAYSPDGFHPLGYACFFGHLAVADVLLARGVDLEAPSKNSMRVRPLHSAVAHSNPEIALQLAQRLLEAGASPNVTQQAGFTPLHEAALRGHQDLFRLLVLKGADCEARNEAGDSPADIARSRGIKIPPHGESDER